MSLDSTLLGAIIQALVGFSAVLLGGWLSALSDRRSHDMDRLRKKLLVAYKDLVFFRHLEQEFLNVLKERGIDLNKVDMRRRTTEVSPTPPSDLSLSRLQREIVKLED